MRRLRAPAKLNLCLYVGPTRGDGLHEICSLFAPLSLSDRITVSASDADAVICPGVAGDNLAAAALAALREAGWDHDPVRIEIEKRIPVAAGLGGGSADAAAVLRLAGQDHPPAEDDLKRLAATLGADVTSQLEPRLSLVRGAGELVEEMGDPEPFGVVLIPFDTGLETATVYTEADRLGTARAPEELDELAGRLREAAAGGFDPLAHRELLVNDLQRAAIALRPEIDEALGALVEAGAEHAMVTGSGPTAVGLCRDIAAADRVASALGPRHAQAIVAVAEVGA